MMFTTCRKGVFGLLAGALVYGRSEAVGEGAHNTNTQGWIQENEKWGEINVARTHVSTNNNTRHPAEPEEMNRRVNTCPDLQRLGREKHPSGGSSASGGSSQRPLSYNAEDVGWFRSADGIQDDSDTWSQASFESSGTFDSNTGGGHGYRGYPMPSLGLFTASRGSLDEMEASPCNTPGEQRRILDAAKDLSLTDQSHKLHVPHPLQRGLSNSMILSWLRFTKYPTITEDVLVGSGTLKADSPLTSDTTYRAAVNGMGAAASGETTTTSPPMTSTEPKPVTLRASFLGRDLNAMTPSCW